MDCSSLPRIFFHLALMTPDSALSPLFLTTLNRLLIRDCMILYTAHQLTKSSIVFHTFNLCKVKRMDDNFGEYMECVGVASGCCEQEAGVGNGSGQNLWVWLLGVVVRRYIDFLILLIPTPLVSVLFYSSIPTCCSFF